MKVTKVQRVIAAEQVSTLLRGSLASDRSMHSRRSSVRFGLSSGLGQMHFLHTSDSRNTHTPMLNTHTCLPCTQSNIQHAHTHTHTLADACTHTHSSVNTHMFTAPIDQSYTHTHTNIHRHTHNYYVEHELTPILTHAVWTLIHWHNMYTHTLHFVPSLF